MANTQTIRLGRDASNNKQWAIKEGGLLASSTATFTDYSDRFIPVEFDVVRSTSATRVNSSGLIESVDVNVPRIDYLNDAKGELLIEPQRTNLVRESENLVLPWVVISSTRVANAAISPDGNNTADKIYPNSSGVFRWVYQDTGVVLNNHFSTFFAKSDGLNFIFFSDGATPIAIIDLTDGNVSSVTAGWSVSTEEQANGWYKVIVQYPASNTRQFIAVGCSDGVDQNVTANGTDGVLLWGFQVEQGSYATSYIPTSGSTVTRNADVISKAGISTLLGDSEGTIFYEAMSFSSDEGFISLSNGSTSNQVRTGFGNLGGFSTVVTVGGANQVVNGNFGAYTAGTFYKFAMRYASNDFNYYVNGSSILTNTSGITFPATTLSRIYFAQGDGSLKYFYGRIRQLTIFDTALIDSEMSTLTTY